MSTDRRGDALLEPETNMAAGFTSGRQLRLRRRTPGPRFGVTASTAFNYGCSMAWRQGAAEISVACNITLTGYKSGSSTPAAVQTIRFTPGVPLAVISARSAHSRPRSRPGLEYVNFTFTAPTLVVVLNDNLCRSHRVVMWGASIPSALHQMTPFLSLST